MWSGWRRGPAERKAARALAQVRRLRAPDLRRMHLPDLKGLHLPELKGLHLPELKGLHLPELHAPDIDWRGARVRSRARALWPAVLAAAGAGVAVWSWNQWARGRMGAEAQAEQDGRDAREAGLAPVRPRADEQSARARAAGEAGVAAPESIMAHAADPQAEEGVSGLEGETLPAHVRAALDESLAVQASGEAPARSERV